MNSVLNYGMSCIHCLLRDELCLHKYLVHLFICFGWVRISFVVYLFVSLSLVEKNG